MKSCGTRWVLKQSLVRRTAGAQSVLLGALLLTSAVRLVHGQDPLEALAKNYRLVLQNEFVRVIHVTYLPLQKLPVHNHSDKPTVYIYLNDSGPVRFSHIEEHAFSLVRPAEKAGTFRFSPGRLERHTVENLGNIPSQFLRVELRQLPLGYQGESFRSPKSFDGTHSGVRTEFDTPLVKVQRVVAAAGETTEVQAGGAPALFVAFSPTLIRSIDDSGKTQRLICGDVLWADPHRAFRVSSAGVTTPGHLLRIIVEPQRNSPG